MGPVLNQFDVERLLKQPSPHVRAIVANKLSVAMESYDLSDHELNIAKDIVRKMAVDVDMQVRLAVAKNLRYSKHLPHDVALKLAHDVEAVALPILTDLDALTDDDLIELVKSSEAVKQKAIASRAVISEKLSDVIITTADENAVASLMDNTGAKISDPSFDKAVDRFVNNELVQEHMIMREVLPAAVAERLAVIVSEKLQRRLIARHSLPPAMAVEISQRSREMAVIAMNRSSSAEDLEHLVIEMHRKGRLTPSIVLRGLCTGNLMFFEFALAELASIPINDARTLIHDPGNAPLESLCRKALMPTGFMPIIRIGLHAREDLDLGNNEDDLKRYRSRIIERVLTHAPNMDDKDVDYFLDLISERVTHH